MGTNYYAYTLPSSGISKYFKETLDAQKYLALKDDLLTYLNTSICHLGKKSIGWKFIWNPNYRIDRAEYLAGCPYIIKYMAYMFSKDSITRFILRPNIFCPFLVHRIVDHVAPAVSIPLKNAIIRLLSILVVVFTSQSIAPSVTLPCCCAQNL